MVHRNSRRRDYLSGRRVRVRQDALPWVAQLYVIIGQRDPSPPPLINPG